MTIKRTVSVLQAVLLTVLWGSSAFAYDISSAFLQIIIDRWSYDIPATVKETIKVKNYEFGSNISNTMLKTCVPTKREGYEDVTCKIDKYGEVFIYQFKFGNIENGINTTVNEKGELLAIRGTLPTTDAIELSKILTEKYGKPSLDKSEKYYSELCTSGAPYLTSHAFWADTNGTVIQLDSTYFSYETGSRLYKSCKSLGRITIMSKPYIDNIKNMLIKFDDDKKQEKEREKKKAIDNL